MNDDNVILVPRKWMQDIEGRLEALEAAIEALNEVPDLDPNQALQAGLASYRARKHRRAEA